MFQVLRTAGAAVVPQFACFWISIISYAYSVPNLFKVRGY